MRRGRGAWAVALAGAAALACWAAPARAAKVDDKLATELGQEVVQAAHPTAKDISLLEHKETATDGRLVLHIRMKYYGKVTSEKYTADVTITVDPSKEPPRVVDVAYKDDNRVPASRRGLKEVNDKVERRLPKKL